MGVDSFNNIVAELFDADISPYLQYGYNVFWFSLICFIGSMCAALLTIYYLPDNHFMIENPYVNHRPRSSLLFRILVYPIKNIFGFILLVIGILFLILPGQGLLTILLGLLIMDFPGKHVVKSKLVGNMKVRQSLNWLRAVLKKPPFAFYDDDK